MIMIMPMDAIQWRRTNQVTVITILISYLSELVVVHVSMTHVYAGGSALEIKRTEGNKIGGETGLPCAGSALYISVALQALPKRGLPRAAGSILSGPLISAPVYS